MDRALQTLRYIKQLCLPEIDIDLLDTDTTGICCLRCLDDTGRRAFAVILPEHVMRGTQTYFRKLHEDSEYTASNTQVVNLLLDNLDELDVVRYIGRSDSYLLYFTLRDKARSI